MAFQCGVEPGVDIGDGSDGLQDVPGLNYRANGRTLRVLITDPPNRNALTRAALDSLYETIGRFDELLFDRLIIEFDTTTTSVACAGLNLRDFEASVRQMGPGEDMLGADHYLVRATAALRALSRRVRTEAIVAGHLVGAGVELALSCRDVACVRSDAKILLPHLRIGVPYHTAGIVHMAGIMGWDVLSRAMVTDAIPVLLSEVLAARPTISGLAVAGQIHQAKVALGRMAAVFHGQEVQIGDDTYSVEDRTGKTRHIAEAHMIQIMSHVFFGADIDDVPSALQEIIDAPRIRASSCAESRVTDSIAAHREKPKQLNRHFSKAIGAHRASDAAT